MSDGTTHRLVLTAEQVAELLAVPVETVRNQRRCKSLRGVLVGKHLRFRLEDVEAYVANLTD